MDRDRRRSERNDRDDGGSSRSRPSRRDSPDRGKAHSSYRDTRYGRRGRRSRSTSRERSPSRERRRSRSISRERKRSRSRSVSRERRRSRSRDNDDRRRERGSRSDRERERSRSPARGREEDDRREVLEVEKREEEAVEDNWSGPRASIKEENGEISCSVEETNRIRKLLGLKPLTSGRGNKKDQEAIENSRKKREEEQEIAARAAMEARIEKARNRRLLTQKLAGKSLGEVLEEEEDMNSAAKWIERSRKVEEERKRKAKEEEERAKKAARTGPAYTSKDLAGLKIAHDASELQDDASVILTLKDTSVLGEGEEEDELENLNLTEMQKTEERKERERRSKLPAYSGYDDDEFKDPESALQGKPKLLIQYDEEKAPKRQIVLDRQGKAALDVGGAEKTIALPGKKEFSLAMDKTQAAREYYTQEEMAKFSKPKKLRKKKIRRKVEDEEDEAADEQADAANTSGDHGSRATTQAKAEAAKNEEQKRKKEAFNTAKEKAEAAAAKLRAAPPPTAPQLAEEDGEEDADLMLSLERARRLALKAKAKEGDRGLESGPLSMAERVRAMAARKESGMEIEGGKKIIFSQTTEFSRRLEAQMREKGDERSQAGRERGREDAMDIEEGTGEGKEEEDEDEEKQEENWGQDLPLAGHSMAAALQLLNYTGDLRDGGKEEQAGRAKDERVDLQRLGDPAPEIKLEYRDEYGRLLTLKEAYRQLSYRFHGQKPGKKKQDKRLKKLQEEIKAKKIFSGEYESRTMGALKQQQEQSGQAYIVLSGTARGSSK